MRATKSGTDESPVTVEHPVLAQRFARLAQVECRGSSPLYEALSSSIAADDDMLHLAAHAAPAQPVPNLFFAAVHFLLVTDASRATRGVLSEPDRRCEAARRGVSGASHVLRRPCGGDPVTARVALRADERGRAVRVSVSRVHARGPARG